MILLDTNVVVALADLRDELNRRAVSDVQKLKRKGLLLPGPVLSEALILLPRWETRARLRSLIQTLEIEPFQLVDDLAVWEEIFSWLFRYNQHSPDWVDAYLAVASSHEPRLKVWTYDQEFWKVWRRPNGSRIPLAVAPLS
jgi:predicted nucleic acid-binding protein